MIPLYNHEALLDAIKEEGLSYESWGYKTPYCIWIYTDGMEKKEIWDKFPSPLTGYEQANWDRNCIERVTYFLIKGSCGYYGNLQRLNYQVENPNDKSMIIPDDRPRS